MARITVDNSGNTMGGTVTIADLARFTFDGLDSDNLTVYEAGDLLDRDWWWEMAPGTIELENGVGVRVSFKDGSALSVGAWADCCDGNGYCPQCWEGVTRFSSRASA